MGIPCKICACETWSFFNEIFKVTYHVCPECELIFKEPQDLISRDAELEIYETHENSIEDLTYVAYFKHFLEAAVLPFEPRGRSGLDFGSGPSPVLATLLERDYGYEMDIYDLFYSPARVYETKSYDLIVSTEVVEHFADPLKNFRMMVDVLKNEGILAIMTQFHRNDLKHFTQWHYMRDRSHIAFYTEKTMGRIADLLGLEMIYCDQKRYTTFKLK